MHSSVPRAVIYFCNLFSTDSTVNRQVLWCYDATVTVWGRFGSKPCRFPRGGQVCCHRRPLHIWANRDSVFGRPQHFNSPALGRRISQISGEVRESGFLFQRCSMLVQRFNAILLHDSLLATDCTLFSFFYIPSEYIYRGLKNNNNNTIQVSIGQCPCGRNFRGA